VKPLQRKATRMKKKTLTWMTAMLKSLMRWKRAMKKWARSTKIKMKIKSVIMTLMRMIWSLMGQAMVKTQTTMKDSMMKPSLATSSTTRNLYPLTWWYRWNIVQGLPCKPTWKARIDRWTDWRSTITSDRCFVQSGISIRRGSFTGTSNHLTYSSKDSL